MSIFTTPLIILFLFFVLISTVFIVRQQSAAIVERFGKFQSVRKPGIQVKIPLVDRIAGRLSLKVLQLDVVVETKTSDDVFVKLKVSVQYRVVESKVFDAFYKLDFPQDQITSYVFDVVRAEVPKMILDDVFEKKDELSQITINLTPDITYDSIFLLTFFGVDPNTIEAKNNNFPNHIYTSAEDVHLMRLFNEGIE